ncbi:MAG: TonB-dependent receptor [Parabacteroides sp.]|uniref:TonB-dependent receptor n=1 Tax=Parabacteroides faecalis TaxID=2924040 RepID=A0ABT0C524_9BACT|nr:TonB-dependent receptor [Parabacteroides faecalis]MCI7287749.1 TonB-dependent receptor [Parabacteroides sp.]MDY5624078.1 TonB-dependent receptor [Bacteroidales bacterium]MCJ2382060.1 TonB-dependent receptor [Parabacteroides faecalis]MDD6952244.1 TonB-dependent receptor [Parabacteroides sp.]MDD7561056.1 TonB-dependent receptor [Parabacteroides sp.]
MRKKYIYILISLFLVVMETWAQSFTVQGVVVEDKDNGIPLVGVNVFIKNKPGVGVITDMDGKFKIEAVANDLLQFSYLGYDNYEYRVTKSELKLQVKLKESSTVLEEAVVVGMGTQRKVSVVGAIASVKADELEAPATNINNMLGGRVPGVIAIQSSGEPGKNISEFWVRGIGTFGANSSALVLIDGLEGRLSDVDPADIESFSVLKDASATAVYGVRGANGVVLVTTKRGREDRLQITARANVTISQLTRLPEYLGAYDYAKLANEARVVSDMEPIYSPMELDLIKYKLDPDLYPDVNWQDEVLKKTSLQHTYYVSARGGGSIARYFVSLNASMQEAAYKQDPNSRYKSNVGYNNYGYRANIDVNVTKSTQMYLGVDGFLSSTNQPGMANTDKLWAAQAALTPLTIPTKFSTGQLPAYDAENAYSPYVMLNHTGTNVFEEYKNMVTLALNQDLSMVTKGLTASIQGALNTQTNFTETRYIMPDLYAAVGRATDGSLQLVRKVNSSAANYSNNTYFWRKFHFEGKLNYDRLFGEDHRVGGLLYYYMSDEQANDATSSMAAIPKRYQGVSARLTYGYKDTYMIDLNGGYTGSENFEPGKQFGFFPSIALGWVFTNYDFMKRKAPWLTFGKIRASYGTAGNDRISDTRFPYLTQVNSEAGSGWGSTTGGIIESVIGANNLAWEKAKKTDIGLDLRMFKDKFTLTVDYFNDLRDGIFQQRTQIPDFAGTITMPFGNVGRMRSYGSDGNFAYSDNIGKDFSFTIRGNFTYSTNYVDEWEQAYPKYNYQVIADNPYNITRGYIALGLFKDDLDVASSPKQFGTVRPGDIKYKDVNGDGVISTDDQVPLSYSNYPRLMYGFGGEFKWKNWTLAAMFKGTGRTDIYHAGRGYNMGYIPFEGDKTGNVLTIVADQKNRWTPAWYSGDPSTENPNAKFPRLSYGHNENNTQLSTFWHDDARYLRLQELSLTYNWRPKITFLGVKSVDFQFVGYDLCVWDKIDLFDPEQAEKNGTAYPIPRRFAFQMYLNF